MSPSEGSVSTSSVGADRSLGPGVAGLVECVVDPRQRAHSGVGVDCVQLPMAIRDRPAPWGRARSAGTAAQRAGRADAAGTPRPSPPSRYTRPGHRPRRGSAGAWWPPMRGSGGCRRSRGTNPRIPGRREDRTARSRHRYRPSAAADPHRARSGPAGRHPGRSRRELPAPGSRPGRRMMNRTNAL